jgi:CopG family nickel-responsive transcriptional regulator
LSLVHGSVPSRYLVYAAKKFIKLLQDVNKIYLSVDVEFNNLVRDMTVISVSVPEKLLEHVENSIKEQGFSNRSEIIRQALRAFIRESKSLRELEGQIAASITIIYERGARKGQISEIQHSFGNIISTFLHAHIEEDYCIEVIVVKGEAEKIRKLVEAFRTNEQINQIKVSILKTSKKPE